MAQLFFPPYHTDPAVLTMQRYVISLLCQKVYDGSLSKHLASNLYLHKVDDPKLLKGKNLTKHPAHNMESQVSENDRLPLCPAD